MNQNPQSISMSHPRIPSFYIAFDNRREKEFVYTSAQGRIQEFHSGWAPFVFWFLKFFICHKYNSQITNDKTYTNTDPHSTTPQ